MELRALRCFVAVADAGTVTAGAAALGVGQPGVSRQIRQLERQLRVELFHREDGRLHLTAAGRDVLEVARETLAKADEVAATAAAMVAGRLERVRLAATGTTCDDVLAPWLATWGPEAPLPSVAEASADDLYGAVWGDVDMVIAPTPPPETRASRVVAELPVWACVAPGHPWAGRGSVGLDEVAEAPLLLLEEGFHARRRLDRALEDADLRVEPVAVFGSPIVAQAVAAAGRGICILTDDARFDLVPLGILDGDDRRLEIRLHAAWEPRHHAADTLDALARDLARFVRERYAAG